MPGEANGVLGALLDQVDGMRVHKGTDGRPSLKKPLLLLVVLSKLERGDLSQNRIRFDSVSDELADLIRRFGGRETRGGASPDQPFVYMSTAPFWQLHLPANTSTKTADLRKRAVLNDPETYAVLADEVHRLLSSSADARHRVANAILDKWWDGAERSELKAALRL